MLQAFSVGGIMVDDVKALRLDVCLELLKLAKVIVSFYEPQIEDSIGSCGNNISRKRTDVAAFHAVDI